MYNLTRINVGEFEILDSGCVTSLANRDIIFTLEGGLQVCLHFETLENQSQSITAHTSDNLLTINFINFNNVLGTELTNPIEVGVINGQRLFCHFRVSSMNDSENRVVFYSWMLRNNISDGE